MLHPANVTTSPAERSEPLAPTRLPADVPSDQLWREAIQATRAAASAAAELRRVLGPSRPSGAARGAQ